MFYNEISLQNIFKWNLKRRALDKCPVMPPPQRRPFRSIDETVDRNKTNKLNFYLNYARLKVLYSHGRIKSSLKKICCRWYGTVFYYQYQYLYMASLTWRWKSYDSNSFDKNCSFLWWNLTKPYLTGFGSHLSARWKFG